MQTLSLTEKIEDELYPILATSEELPNELIRFVDNKLKTVLNEIQQAERELTDRIQTIGNLEAKDQVSIEKIVQVKNNLNSIKTKLCSISADYSELVNIILSFLREYQKVYENIRDYFARGEIQPGSSHESFKNGVMDIFRSLLAQSEVIIEKIRNQEPPVAKEHDTDKVITLLEKLRIFFESNAATSSESSESIRSEFIRSCMDLNNNIDDLYLQLNDIKEKFGESSAAYKVTSLSYGYYERNVDVSRHSMINVIGNYKKYKNFHSHLCSSQTHFENESEKFYL